jgi:hypothetical protein
MKIIVVIAAMIVIQVKHAQAVLVHLAQTT